MPSFLMFGNYCKIKIEINTREYIALSFSIGWGLLRGTADKSWAWVSNCSVLSIANIFINIFLLIKPAMVDRSVSIEITKDFRYEADVINNLFVVLIYLVKTFFSCFICFDKYP